MLPNFARFNQINFHHARTSDKYKIPDNFKQVAQKAIDLERYKTREDELRVEDSIKEGVIISLKEENKTFALKLAEIQERETRSSNEVGSNSFLIFS